MSEPASKEDLRQFRGQLEQNLLELLKDQGKIVYDESGMMLVEEQIIKTAIDMGIYNEDWLDGL